jgi:HAE1 family hydrophobic/amphiphilic exporter-1
LSGPVSHGVVGANVSLTPMPVLSLGGDDGGGDGTQYSYVLRGVNTELLYEVSEKFYNQVSKLEGFRDVQTTLDLNAPQLSISIKRERASKLGVTAESIEETLLLAFAGYKISSIKEATEDYKVIMELDPAKCRTPSALDSLYVRPSDEGTPVPLVEVAGWRMEAGPMEVKHLNRQSEVKINFNLDKDTPLGVATERLDQLAAVTIPPSIVAGFEGEAAEFKKTVSTLMYLMIVALLVMYLVLGVLYESYIHPITVLSALPVAGFGGVLSLWVFGSELSIYAFIGLFMLMGIVKKNGIMMVDFANQRLGEGGVSRSEAIFEACQARFRPIVMTGLAAIMGVMPIALGLGADGSSRQPMGLTVVGGLIFSQLITLFITPVIYLYMEWFQEKVLFRFAFFRPPKG